MKFYDFTEVPDPSSGVTVARSGIAGARNVAVSPTVARPATIDVG